MKRVWLTISTIVGFVMSCVIIFNIATRPLISPNKAMATAKQQLRIMGYEPPYNGIYMGTSLEWYNHGRLFGAEHVYVTTISFQPTVGASAINVQVVEDARTANVILMYDHSKPYEKPLF